MTTNNIMVDLETFSIKPNAMIISIGAVRFDIDQPALSDDTDLFYTNIDIDSYENPHGYHIDTGTIKWWMGQSQDARNHIIDKNVHDARTVFEEFGQWISQGGVPYIWGNGANFDNVLLRNAFEVEGIPAPWKYYNDRCYRTLAALNRNIPKIKPKIAHHALSDAIAQTEHLLNIIHNPKG